MMKLFSALCCFLSCQCSALPNPFGYDLHLTIIPGTDERTIICFHGYGANYQLANNIKDSGMVDATLVSFNFPDHDLDQKSYDPKNLAFGTIRELLPAFYVLKQIVIENKVSSIDLYGFSAGGGVIVNLIATLNSSLRDQELGRIGIGENEKKILLDAIQKGIVMLDVPLKSIDEIIALRGTNPEFERLAENYRKNQMRPIDSLNLLKGLSLNVIVYFEQPDDIIGNQDDQLYIERLKKANTLGNTWVILESHGGHLGFHSALWKLYQQKAL